MKDPIIETLKKIKSDAFTLAFYPLFIKITTRSNDTIEIPYEEIIAVDPSMALVIITRKRVIYVSYVTGKILEKILNEEERKRLIINLE